MENIEEIEDTSLLTKKEDIDNENIFKEKEINKVLFDYKEKFTTPSPLIIKLLKRKLLLTQEIPENEKKIIVNNSIAVKNLILHKEDEENEGRKIIKYIIDTMMMTKKLNKENTIEIFTDLKMSIFNGYVHIARKGLQVSDKITGDLIPNLKYFNWQYNIPIDYDTLKYVLFQNKFQKNLQDHAEQQEEAEKILSQDYLICLQPSPEYQMWCLKRLIMCWYADVDLQNNIRKIKILINIWRSKTDEEYNIKNGVLPSIVVYPRYGRRSAKIVITKLSEYFLLYHKIGWEQSKPSYFLKINNLLWYTNGSIDLKMYFKKAKKYYKNTITSKPFSDDLTKINSNGPDIFYPFKL